MAELTHYDDSGRVRMVDVSNKTETEREAVAHAFVELGAEVLEKINQGTLRKGDPLEVARIAGIQAAKRTGELIPLCHPLGLTYSDVQISLRETGAEIEATVRCRGRTGVEMEAMTAASVAALTIYDMCKAVDKGITIKDVYLLRKRGGKSGAFER